MYSIHTRDDLEKLKKLQETKCLIFKERLKEKLGKQDFHYDLEEVFEPVTTKQVEATENQKQLSEKQIQALHDSTRAASQTVQAIKNQTQAIRESSNALNKNLQKSIKEGIQEYDEITNRNNQLLTSLVTSNQVDSSIVKTVSNLLSDKNKSQFSIEPVMGYPRSSANLFTINPHNPQQVLIKGSTMTFENGNSYNLNDSDLQYFITNTQFDKPINDWDAIYNFLNDMKYDLNYGDKKSIRYQLIKELQDYMQGLAGSSATAPAHEATQGYTQGLAQDYTQAHDLHGQSQGFTGSSATAPAQDYTQGFAGSSATAPTQGYTGSGLQGCAQGYTRSSTHSPAQQYIFLPSDPDELVDKLKLLYFEKVGGNDSFLINEEIIAIIDKLLEYECISPSQHQNMQSYARATHEAT